MVNTVQLNIGFYGDLGKQRELNEDSFLVLTPPALSAGIDALLVVADGMGGHQSGEVASQALVELLAGMFCSEDYQRIVAYSPQHEDYYVVVLKEVLEWANERLYQLAAARTELNGMGTTVTAALMARGKCFWGHVGDSRAYLLHGQQLQQLTMDHTWVNEQVIAGVLSPEEASVHPRRNVLTRALGGDPLVRIDRDMFSLHIGDRLLLCSDGLSGVVQASEIHEVLAVESDPQRACDHLGSLANQRGGPDNITILTAYVGSDTALSRPIPDGRIIGPLPIPYPVIASPSSTCEGFTQSRTDNKSRCSQSKLKAYLTLVGWLLFGVLLSGLGMLLFIVFMTSEPWSLVAVAVLIFSWGALLGRWIGCYND